MVETMLETVHLVWFLYTTKMLILMKLKLITLVFTAQQQQQQDETTSHLILWYLRCSLNVQKVTGFSFYTES